MRSTLSSTSTAAVSTSLLWHLFSPQNSCCDISDDGRDELGTPSSNDDACLVWQHSGVYINDREENYSNWCRWSATQTVVGLFEAHGYGSVVVLQSFPGQVTPICLDRDCPAPGDPFRSFRCTLLLSRCYMERLLYNEAVESSISVQLV